MKALRGTALKRFLRDYRRQQKANSKLIGLFANTSSALFKLVELFFSNFNLLKELVSNYKKLDGEESHWYKWIKIPQKEINLNHPYLKVDGSKLHQLWYGTIKHAAGINTNNPKREKAEKSKKNKKKSKANKIIKAKGLNGLIKCLGCGAYCSNTSPLGRCGLCQIKK